MMNFWISTLTHIGMSIQTANTLTTEDTVPKLDQEDFQKYRHADLYLDNMNTLAQIFNSYIGLVPPVKFENEPRTFLKKLTEDNIQTYFINKNDMNDLGKYDGLAKAFIFFTANCDYSTLKNVIMRREKTCLKFTKNLLDDVVFQGSLNDNLKKDGNHVKRFFHILILMVLNEIDEYVEKNQVQNDLFRKFQDELVICCQAIESMIEKFEIGDNLPDESKPDSFNKFTESNKAMRECFFKMIQNRFKDSPLSYRLSIAFETLCDAFDITERMCMKNMFRDYQSKDQSILEKIKKAIGRLPPATHDEIHKVINDSNDLTGKKAGYFIFRLILLNTTSEMPLEDYFYSDDIVKNLEKTGSWMEKLALFMRKFKKLVGSDRIKPKPCVHGIRVKVVERKNLAPQITTAEVGVSTDFEHGDDVTEKGKTLNGPNPENTDNPSTTSTFDPVKPAAIPTTSTGTQVNADDIPELITTNNLVIDTTGHKTILSVFLSLFRNKDKLKATDPELINEIDSITLEEYSLLKRVSEVSKELGSTFMDSVRTISEILAEYTEISQCLLVAKIASAAMLAIDSVLLVIFLVKRLN